MLFRDRSDAGRRLAPLLVERRTRAPLLVFGLPRGGVPVAAEVARTLGASLDIWGASAIGAPDLPERVLGAIAEGGGVHLELPAAGASETELVEVVEREDAELERQVAKLRQGRPRARVFGARVILVEEGIQTAARVRAAARAIRALEPERLTVAAPIASAQAVDAIRPEVDRIVCVRVVDNLRSIGAWYDDFDPISDFDIISLLAGQPAAAPPGALPRASSTPSPA